MNGPSIDFKQAWPAERDSVFIKGEPASMLVQCLSINFGYYYYYFFNFFLQRRNGEKNVAPFEAISRPREQEARGSKEEADRELLSLACFFGNH